MRAILSLVFAIALTTPVRIAGQPPKSAPDSNTNESAAAEFTRTKMLKAKVTVSFTDTPIGEILKEFAHLAEQQVEGELMWAYGEKFPFAQKVTFAADEQPLEEALGELLTKAGGGLGYIVVSEDDGKYDGWVRMTTTGERGREVARATPEEEKTASARLTLVKKLIDGGNVIAAKPVLEQIIRNYPTTTAATQARELLKKLEK